MDLWKDFIRIAHVLFAQLEEEYGFVRSEPEYPFLNYDSSKIKVSLFYDSRGICEMDGTIRRRTNIKSKNNSYPIPQLLALHDPSSYERYSVPHPKNVRTLNDSVKILRDILFICGHPILDGDMSDLNRLDTIEQILEAELRVSGARSYLEIVKEVLQKNHKMPNQAMHTDGPSAHRCSLRSKNKL